MRRYKRRNLTERETADLVAFMQEALRCAGNIQKTCFPTALEAETARALGVTAKKYLSVKAPHLLPDTTAHSTGQFMGSESG